MKIIKKERGQSLVELSISILVLLLILVGAVEFGMAFFQFVQLRDAAQEGALYGSLYPFYDANGNGKWDTGENSANVADIRARVRNSSNSPIKLGDSSVVPDANIIVTLTSSNSDPKRVCEGIDTNGNSNGIKVRIEFQHDVFMPFMKAIIGDKIKLNAEVTDTILSPRCPK